MNSKLSPNQKKIFDFLCDFINKFGFPPSYKDIAEQFKFSSVGTVRTYLEYLEKKGYIERHGKARGIKIKTNVNNSIPILGDISAGNPIDTYENILGLTNDIKCIKFKNNRFGLNVKGNSMINAGILDKDIAIIEKTEQYKTGEIVAILIENQATLKKIEFKKNKIICIPENNNYSIIEISKKDQSLILGKLVGIIRNYI